MGTAKLIWRVKLVLEAEQGVVSETEVARIGRDDLTLPETLGLTLQEAKQTTAAMQTRMVCAQVAIMGERFRCCGALQDETAQQGLLPDHVPLFVRRR